MLLRLIQAMRAYQAGAFAFSCTGTQETTTNACHNVEQGATITFSADILPTSCLDEDKKHVFTISPLGLNQVRLIRKSQLLLILAHFPLFQSLSIEVETVCDCPCEHRGNPGFEADSEACSGGNGDNACGVCFCHENFSGDACECDDQALVGSDNESNGEEHFSRVAA